jgi:hypothetical protein
MTTTARALCGKRAQNLKSIQDKRNLRRIGAEQDNTLNLHHRVSRIKST